MASLFNVLKLSSALAVAATYFPSAGLTQSNENFWDVVCAEQSCTGFAVSQDSTLKVIVYFVADALVIEILTPLGINLQHGVDLRVDETRDFQTQLLSCELDGCRAFTQLNDSLLTALQNGLSLKVVIQTSRSREILGFDFSLIGFTDMIANLRSE